MLPNPLASILLIVGAVFGAMIGLSRWRVRHRRAQARTGAYILWCASFWLAATGLQLASTAFEAKLAWSHAQFLGMLPIPVLWLHLVTQFTGFDRFMTRRRLMLLSIIPILTMVLAVTDQHHGLIFAYSWLDTTTSPSILRTVFGPGLWIGVFYSYGLLVTATLLFVWMMIRRPGFLWQGSALLIAALLSIGANIIDLAERSPFGEIDLTPLTLLITVPLFIASLIRLQRTDIVPVARGSVLNGMQDPVLVLDNDNRIVDLNPAAQQLIGWQLPQVRGKSLTAAWPSWRNYADKFSQDDLSVPAITLSHDERQHTYTVSVSRLKDWRDEVISRILVFRDISELVDVEEALRHSEEHFRALIENSSDVTIIIGSDASICYVSPALERIFKRTPDQVVGHSTFDFIHPDDVSQLFASIVEQRLDDAHIMTARFHDAEGHWHILEFTARNLLEHPAVQGIVINARDVTEREYIAQTLRQSEERYRLHFAHVNDVIYSFDSQFTVLSVTPSVERHLGIKPEELIGKSMLALDVLPAEYLEKAATEAARVLSGERIEGSVYEFITKDGARVSAEVSGNPLYHDGKIIGVINVARNITERMKANEQLKASLAEKEILLKEIHHRVKNNMQIITSLLHLQSSASDDPDVRAQFTDSENRIRSMAFVHERLYRSLDLACIDFGDYLKDLIGHLVQAYQAHSKGVVIVIDAENVRFDIDTAIPCGLIVNELVSNALKHAFPDREGGVIRVEAKRDRPDSYCLSVCDNGVGMPSDIDLVHSRTLGLQLVTSLSRQLHGTVSLDGERGTRVALRFSSGRDHTSGLKPNIEKVDQAGTSL